MGKGGGGGPQKSTTETSNIPEYARPYVMNMLGAAQNQLFTNTPGTTNADGTTTPGQITGFKPYSAYSSNPTDYFAGPSSLQNSAYNAAGQLQSPSQYQTGTQLAGMAGLGQFGTAQQAGMYGQQGNRLGMMGAMQAMPAFGAGQQYSNQVTDPNEVGSYMSPYQQQVTDVAKMNAVREAQIAGNQANLGAARQGTYGGARQALAGAERERNLLGNLSNIQAQGSQSAYDRAIQNMQYGSNLGLQGIQTGLQGISAGQQGVSQGLQGVGAQQAGYAGAGQAASTLGQLGSAQNATDVQNINLQNQLGGQQQQYQQGIINQAIQDYATQQQYPYMQLSTMSNLLRGLPMQSMSTQQYQAQPSATQQLVGLGGTAAMLGRAGVFKEGGAVKGLGYANRGQVDSMRDRLEEMFATDAEDTARYVSQSSSPAVKKLARELGIGAAPTGKLGTNMAGGGIIAFEEGGNVQHFYNEGAVKDPNMYDEEGNYIPLDKRNAAQNQNIPLNKFFSRFFSEEGRKQAGIESARRKELDPRARQGDQPGDYPMYTPNPVIPSAAPAGIPPAGSAAPAAVVPVNTNTNTDTSTGLQAILAARKKELGGEGEKNKALMQALEERQAGISNQNEADRYLRGAEAFARFGSTAGPIGSTAAEALGGFAKGEATARKEDDKMKLEGMKMQADLERARRAEARGDYDAAQKAYDSYEDRQNRRDVANIGAAATGRPTQLEETAIDRIMKEKGVDFATAYREVKGAGKAEGIDMQIAKNAYAAVQASIAPGGANSKQYKELLKSDPTGVAAQQFADKLAQDQIRGMKATMGMGGGSSTSSGKVIDFGSIK